MAGTVPDPAKNARILIEIKLLHTLAWAVFAGSIVALPFVVHAGRLPAAAVLSGIVFVECGILALNRCRCPLTDLAAARTPERGDNFDIYLPAWLARYNKAIFGTWFALDEIYLLIRWMLLR